MKNIFHALGLHMHQPPGNLRLLLETNSWEAKEIICCYKRPVTYIQQYPKTAHLNIGFSGILLEQLIDAEIQKDYKDICDIQQMLSLYQEVKGIEIIGMGYYHPIFPLIPVEDWEAHLILGRERIKEVFGSFPRGFWPSEMAFCMEMIPWLKKAGYEYVVIDNVHVKPESSGDKQGTINLLVPHIARYDGHEIVVCPRNRDLSNAQESGLDPIWFENEVLAKTRLLEGNILITTWSDGENGGWFRQMHEEAGFWGHFFAPFMERIKQKETTIKSISLSDYIDKYTPKEYVFVQTGAWNVGRTSGFDFSQWSGSPNQKRALEDVWNLSRDFHSLEKRIQERQQQPCIRDFQGVKDLLDMAHNLLLKSETSCYFFWGDAWIPKVYDQIKPARDILNQITEILA